MIEIFEKTKAATLSLLNITDEEKALVLNDIADIITGFCEKFSNEFSFTEQKLLDANAKDLAQMDKSNPLYDRLLLNSDRLGSIATDMRNVAKLPSPLGHVIYEKVLENGLQLRRVTVPFGVIGVIYEARPNVSFDVFSLCFKSGNACILKGGSDARNSNEAIVCLIKSVLQHHNINPDIINLLPPSRESTQQMLSAVGYVDLCIPRGGKKLIEFVRNNAKIPVIETGAGVVHAYLDKDANLEKAKAIINNAKTRRVSVCNALDCLLVHSSRLKDLDEICGAFTSKVTIYTDAKVANYLSHKDDSSSYDLVVMEENVLTNSEVVNHEMEGACNHSGGKDKLSSVAVAGEDLYDNNEGIYGKEWMDYKLSIKAVDSLEQALEHIRKYSSGHSECIITENEESAAKFQQMVDAACVYVNVPTSFTDGAQFGLGAEIGISTQKLGPRGPMALNEMVSYKWLINGNGQIRKP